MRIGSSARGGGSVNRRSLVICSIAADICATLMPEA
jgi:hypothetical protein